MTNPEVEKLYARAALPRYFRIGAVAVLGAVAVVGILVYLIQERPSDFRMKGFPAKLSKDVVAVVVGYERREMDGDIVSYYLKADKATTYSDNHQELEAVYLEVYDETGARFDRITSEKAVYLPEANRMFTVFLSGQVEIFTRDALRVRTEEIRYARSDETAVAEEKVEFEREEIRGSSTGAVVHVRDKRLELLKDVQIGAVAGSAAGDLSKNGIDSFKASSGAAVIDQTAGTASLTNDVDITIAPSGKGGSPSQTANLKASLATAYLNDKEVSKVELTGGVQIEQAATKGSPRWAKARSGKAIAFIEGEMNRYELAEDAEVRTGIGESKRSVIEAASLSYDKKRDRFDLEGRVSMTTDESERPAKIVGDRGFYEQSAGRIEMSGEAAIITGSEKLAAPILAAVLDTNNKIRSASAKGGAVLSQKTPERTIQVAGSDLSAVFDGEQNLEKADARGGPTALLVPDDQRDYTSVSMTPSKSIRALFGPGGSIQAIETEGRTKIDLTAATSGPEAEDKKLSADNVRTTFAADGRHLERATANGNAELEIVPRVSSAERYRTTVTAPSFECGFFPATNNAQKCTSGLKTRTTRRPTIPGDARGDQTLLSDRLSAIFNEKSFGLDFLEAAGAAKFTELDRNGTAQKMILAQATGVVSLSGGQPLVWDSKGRARAQVIEIDTRVSVARLRGSVSTTYFNQRQLGGAAPFSNASGPVFVTSDSAEFFDVDDRAVYRGNARAWQGDNFMRGDLLEMDIRSKRVSLTGNVQTLVFRAGTKDVAVPMFGSSQKMSYDSAARRVVYEANVELRQGTDRIAGQRVTAILNADGYIVEALAETGVRVTQPGRYATADFARYDVVGELVLLRGNPVRVEDMENGRTEGAEITVNLREKRVLGDGRSKNSDSGRTRTVYRIKKNQ